MDENPYEPPKIPSESSKRDSGDVIAWIVIAICVAMLVAFAWPAVYQ